MAFLDMQPGSELSDGGVDELYKSNVVGVGGAWRQRRSGRLPAQQAPSNDFEAVGL